MPLPAGVKLAAGARLGHYEIQEFIARGSMGEVYRARDSRLRRDVALKVLPTAAERDEGRIRRFEQEAFAAAALNHPNIVTVYDIGAQAGTVFVVSELLRGRTLREVLTAGPPPVAKAIDFATQLGVGLSAAHDQGIVHRDIKPENIFITDDGLLKILDFGIARMVETDPLGDGETVPGGYATEAGMILGTVGYMAPEQVRGQTVDHRADIFAAGCVLYEMLAGRPPFSGGTAADTLSAILTTDPPQVATRDAASDPWLERIVRHCLEKDAANRFQSARDLVFALGQNAGARPSAAVERRRVHPGIFAAALVVATVSAAAAAIWFLNRDEPPATIPLTFDVNVLDDMYFAATTDVAIPQLAVSPDGRAIAFVAEDATGRKSIWLRRLTSTTLIPVPGTDDAAFPFWSPDSTHIGFFSLGKLRKIDIAGGAVHILADALGDARGGAWSPDGTIVFAPGNASGLMRVSAAGGTSAPIVDLDSTRGESGHRWPHFLPDGRRFLFQSRALPEHRGVYVGSLDGAKPRRLLTDQTNAIVTRDGYLLFVRGGALMAQKIDFDRLTLEGEATALVDRIGYSVSLQTGSFTVSDSGVLAYGIAAARGALLWYDRKGKELGKLWDTAEFLHPRLSADDRTVVVARRESEQLALDLWLIDVQRGTPARFTAGAVNERFPVWAPDGSALAFAGLEHTLSDIFIKPVRPNAEATPVLVSNVSKFPSDWSASGQIVYHRLSQTTGWDLFLVDVASKKSTALLTTPFNEFLGQFAADGKWLAYVSDESGTFQVYVQPLPSTGERWQISQSGGTQPRWRRDGRELFFISRDRKLMSVAIDVQPTFQAGAPVPLFDAKVPSVGAQYANDYTVSADGQRFLVNTRSGGRSVPPIKVLMPWQSSLRR